MRKILLFCVLSVMALSVSAQVTFFEDFNVDIPSTWTIIDNDGLSPYYSSTFTDAWVAFEARTGDNAATSTSYYSPAGSSDDWLITPQITVATGDFLVWEALSWNSTYPDGYDVKISTGTAAMTDFTTTLLSVPAEQASWTGHSIDLSSYVGQSVYIAFVNNTNDGFVLSIDNVSVMSTQYDMAGNDAVLPAKIGLNLAPFDITASFSNMALNAVTSFDLNYSVNGGAVVTDTKSGLNIATYGSESVTSATAWTPAAVGTYTIKIWADNINGSNADPNNANDTITKVVEIVAQSAERFPLFEAFTSSTCGPCVSGNANLKTVFDNNPNQWVCVKYQMSWPGDGDPYYTAEGGDRRTYYNINSVPHLMIDGGWDGNSGSVTDAILAESRFVPSFLEITADMTVTGKTCDISVALDPMEDISGNLKLHVAIVEKKTTANVGSNGETEFDWVMKKMVPASSGTTIANLTSGNTHNETLSYTFNGSYRLPANANTPINNATEHSVEEFSDLIAVVWLQDQTTKEVFQAAYSSVTIGLNDMEVEEMALNVFPNPASDVMNITFNNAESQEVTVKVVSNLGQTVYAQSQSMAQGAQSIELNVADLEEGIYFVQVLTAKGSFTKPVVVKH